MKNLKILISLVLCLTVCSTSISAKNNYDIPPAIFDAMKVGNSSELASYFNSSVELVILSSDAVFSKQQAEQILKGFFDKNKVSKFVLLHQGGKEGAQYAIGNIESTDGKTFRVYFLVKENNNKALIHQLRIEEEQ